jgi:4-amino-4-deoxy-L-arabinose transferase-like glycosyltransferase
MSRDLPGKMNAADTRWALALTAAFLIIGAAFAMFVPRGLPYDEPSHFNVVQLNSLLRGLPIVGLPGVTYEACQPPLYYVLAGLVYRAGGSFYVLRLLTLAVSSPIVYLTYRMTREFTGRPAAAKWASLLVALNPAVVAIGAGVQNDSLAFLFSTVASYLCMRWCWMRNLSVPKMLLLSLFSAAAVLTKSSTLPLIPFMAMLVCVAEPMRAAGRLAILAVVVAAGDGWWFLRNSRLYGDWTGGRSVAAVFAHTGRYHPLSLRDWVWVGRSLLTYYTTPVTYWRDEIKNPRWLTIAIGAGTLCVLCGFILALLRRRRPAAGRLACWAAVYALLSVGFWLLVSYRSFTVAARVAMPALAAQMMLVAGALCNLRAFAARFRIARLGLPLLALVMLAADAQLVIRSTRLAHRPYIIDTRQIPS